MSRRSEPLPGVLVVSVIYRLEDRFGEALDRLVRAFGPPARVSDPFPFDRTDYYREEMGEPLFRRFFVAERPLPRGTLPEAKAAAEEIERAYSGGGRRSLNVDPGILTEESFVLATGKPYSHRIYLRDGVYADLTLRFSAGEYRPLPWTYPDYASDGIRAFLGEVREEYRQARRRRAS